VAEWLAKAYVQASPEARCLSYRPMTYDTLTVRRVPHPTAALSKTCRQACPLSIFLPQATC
jgi:hypothetical protein